MKQHLLFGLLVVTFPVWGQNTNCSGATQVCNDVAFSGNSSGAGTQELNASNQGCLGVEHQSSWYYFQPVTSGTVALNITTSVDYDFAIWATGNCNSLGTPVRCSYSSLSGNTGLVGSYYGQTSAFGCGFLGLFPCYGTVTVSDNTEGAGGDAWVAPLNVVAGQTYIMLIDNFTANSTAFTLDWTFSNGATLNCTPIPLPVQLLQLMAEYNEKEHCNKVEWQTQMQRYNDHFTLERSTDGENWSVINEQKGEQLSDELKTYTYKDFQLEDGNINYYRLSQTDINGDVQTYPLISVDNRSARERAVKAFNAMGQEIPIDSRGLVILVYADGTTERVFRE